MRRLLAGLALAGLVGCGPGGSAPDREGHAADGGVADASNQTFAADAASAQRCEEPREGCPCTPGSEPVECFAEPEQTSDGKLRCANGKRYCRDGTWSACESIHTYTLETSGALVSGPSTCNPCNPDCVTTTDEPTDVDLTPENSDDVKYDPDKGGVTLDGGVVTVGGDQDSDGDGVPDASDDCPNQAAGGGDSNGDGVDDDAEKSSDPDNPTFGCPGGTEEGFYHTLPRGGPSEFDPVDFSTQVTTADVYMLIDDSGSMEGEMNNLKSSITSGELTAGCSGGLIGAIKCAIPDAWLGLGSFEEYAVAPYGDSDNTIYQHWQDLTDDVGQVDTAVSQLTDHGNASEPEGATQALWAVATGNSLGGYETRHDTSGCESGQWGFPCFRPDTIPIVILVTDAPFHEGPAVGGEHWYEFYNWCGGSCEETACDTCGSYTCNNWVCDGTTSCSECNGDGSPSIDNWSCDGSTYSCGFFGTSTCCNGDWVCPAGECTGYSCDTGWRCTDQTCDSCADTDCRECPGFDPIKWPEALNALNNQGIRTIVVESSGGTYAGGEARDDGEVLATQTGAVDGNGNPFVYSIDPDGSGLSSNIAGAVQDIANFTRFDVSARPTDDPSTAIDERNFVKGIRGQGWGPGDCQSIQSGSPSDIFVQCTPGTIVDYQVEFRNDFIDPEPDPQVFNLEIEVLLDSSVQKTVPVRIVVPGTQPSFPPRGSYERDYDATKTCASEPFFCSGGGDCPGSSTCTSDADGDGMDEFDQNVCASCVDDGDCPSGTLCAGDGVCYDLDNVQRPDWNDFSWVVETPGDTAVEFVFRTAEEQSELSSANPVSFRIEQDEPDTGTIDVGDLLLAEGERNKLPWLRVTAVLRASSDGTQTPVLREFTTQYTCEDSF